MSFVLQQLKPDTGAVILNQISNKLRNTSDAVLDSTEDVPDTSLPDAMEWLSLSLNLFLTISVLALLLKHWLWIHTPKSRAHHIPEKQAIQRELNAQSYWRNNLLFVFGCLPFLMQIAVYFFFLGCAFTMESLGSKWEAALGFNMSGTNKGVSFLVSTVLFTLVTLGPLIWHGRYAFSVLSLDLAERILARMFDPAPDPEVVYVDISNCVFTHTSMVPKNFPIFIQLFSLPVEHPRLRITSLAPWTHLSSLLPSMLMEISSQSRFNLLPALRLCLVVSGQSEQLWVNREVKRVYSTIKTSTPLQNLYLHLLLSQLPATAGDTDHLQEACRILKCLEYREEHTSELVWLVDSIQLYTLQIKGDFTTWIVEFLRGVVVYLSKCPGNEHNGDLRTATIMAAKWLISRQSCHNGNLPVKYIISTEEVHSGEGEGKRKTFVLVKNQRLSESLQPAVKLYRGLQKTDSTLDFVIRTLLIPLMTIEGFTAEKNGKSSSDAVPRIETGDLRCALEGLWDFWEGGFSQSDFLQFMLTLVTPPSSPAGDTQSSTVILLLKKYLQQTNESPAWITENAFRFIDAAFEHSLTTGTTRGELELQLQDIQFPNTWLALHIDTILRRSSKLCAADLEAVTQLDSRVKAIVSRKRLNLYLSSNVEPEPHVLTLLVQSDDHVISLEAFGQSVNLLESPPTDESLGRDPGSSSFALLEQEKRSHLISCFFDPQQSTSTCQSVWIMLTEDLYPRWNLLPADWRSDIAAALVAATEWMVKGQKILAKDVKKRKAKRMIGATVLALVNYSDIEHHWKRKIALDARDERFEERLDACAQVYLRLFATAVEDLGERAKARTQHIVNFLVDIPDVLYDDDAIKRIRRVLEI